MESKSLTVSEVTAYIKSLLKNDRLLSQLEVIGEISNFHHHRSGHMYFTVKDDDAKLNAVMFKGNNRQLDFTPEDGQMIKAYGYIDLYPPRGEYQLYVQAMQVQGEGDLFQAFIELKEKLEKEGLFAPEKKKPLPEFPKKIGLVTSAGGAAIRDIISVIKRRDAGVSLLLTSSRVQGSEAAAELIKGLRYLDKRPDIDLIIISRGGGSLEDLWPFNNEMLAREIVAAETPIISGVGHETDITISDLAADLRAPTPSAAAELAVQDQASIRERFYNLKKQLFSLAGSKLKNSRREFDYLLNNRIWKNPDLILAQKRQHLDEIRQEFGQTLAEYLRQRREKIARLSLQVDGLSPLKILGRGYSLTEKSGKVVSSIQDVNLEDEIKTRVRDGEIMSKVKEIREGDYGSK
ncbi:MAG: exodeoxyribonuclease VII large subunit [Bacillota bacterium]